MATQKKQQQIEKVNAERLQREATGEVDLVDIVVEKWPVAIPEVKEKILKSGRPHLKPINMLTS